MLDATDRMIINGLQGGFPLTERPFAAAAHDLGLGEGELIARIGRLIESGTLSRFGPMYDAERMGGAFCLCAMSVSPDEFEVVAAKVNAFPEVAHNYEREHELNMWFVLAAEHPERIGEVAREIEISTGFEVLMLPKLNEFFVGLRVAA